MTQRMDAPATAVDFNNEKRQHLYQPTFESVLGARLSRRGLLRGGVGSVGTAVLTGFGVTACGGGDDDNNPAQQPQAAGLQPHGQSLADVVSIPAGYTASVLFALAILFPPACLQE